MRAVWRCCNDVRTLVLLLSVQPGKCQKNARKSFQLCFEHWSHALVLGCTLQHVFSVCVLGKTKRVTCVARRSRCCCCFLSHRFTAILLSLAVVVPSRWTVTLPFWSPPRPLFFAGFQKCTDGYFIFFCTRHFLLLLVLREIYRRSQVGWHGKR